MATNKIKFSFLGERGASAVILGIVAPVLQDIISSD